MHRYEPTSPLRPETVTVASTALPGLVWRPDEPFRACATTALGGGIGVRRWVFNAQVPSGYHHADPEAHLRSLADACGLVGSGVGFLTAADVTRVRHRADGSVDAWGTVGIDEPVWAAAPTPEGAGRRRATKPGTINLVIMVPAPLSDAALVNAVATATEGKAQALRELGLPGTGTATDAVCVLTPDAGRSERYGGPRSQWGSRVARAVHGVVLDGAESARDRSLPTD